MPAISYGRAALAVALLGVAPAAAQDAGKLGKVHFATSCSPAAQEKFNLGMAYQHSFWYSAAIETFNETLALDPTCAMAHWGIALATRLNPYVPPTPKLLADGLAAVDKALALGPKTQREKDYIGALGAFYRDHDKLDHRARLQNHAKAMEQLSERYADDAEAQIYYALALAVSAAPGDKTFANQFKAGKILATAFAAQPRHPGVAHYLIHTYDSPAIAKHGLEAAKAYAKIAPDSPHALHMPSHIFTRLGHWQESADSNRISADVATKSNEIHDHAHALDYIVYAYLQMARDKEAAKALVELAEIKGHGADFFVAPFALTAAPARYAIERSAWAEAAALPVQPSKHAFVDAMTHFARAIGAARSGKPAEAKADADKLAALVVKLREAKNAYWADQVEIQQQAALAWIAFAEGRQDDAIKTMTEVAAREDLTDKHPVVPGPLLPAREMLGEMLLERGRAAEAFAQFELVLTKEPNRFRAIGGAARAADKAGDAAKAKGYYNMLLEVAGRADTEREELRTAKAYVK